MGRYEYFGELQRLGRLEESLSKQKEIHRVGDEESVTYCYAEEFFVKIPSHLNPHTPFSEESLLSNSKVMNDFLVTLMLLKRQYPVIEPYGLYEVTVPGKFLDSDRDIVAPAFVTRYKQGISYLQDKDNGWSVEYEREMDKWIRKAREEGFLPGFDSNFGQNGLWVPSEGKLYLIDFELWTGREDEKEALATSLGFNL